MTTTEPFDAAFLFAVRLHRGQKRKGTAIPYLSHLLSVTALVMEDGGTEEEAIAALLHDAVEDQGDAYPGGRPELRAAIAGRFGARVLEIVDALTDDEGHEKGRAATPEEERVAWRRRKQAYLDHLAGTRDPGIRRVACADKLHNARSILADYAVVKDAVWQRFRTQCAEDQVWYETELARILDGASRLELLFRDAARAIAALLRP